MNARSPDVQTMQQQQPPQQPQQISSRVNEEVAKSVDLYFQSIVVSSEPSFEFLVLTTLIKAVEERLLKNLNVLDAKVKQVLMNKGATDVETQALQDIQEQVTGFHSSLESATGEIVDVLEDEEDLEGLVLSQVKMLNVDPIQLSNEVRIATEAAGNVGIHGSNSQTSLTNSIAGASTTDNFGLHHERSVAIGDISFIRNSKS